MSKLLLFHLQLLYETSARVKRYKQVLDKVCFNADDLSDDNILFFIIIMIGL
jgi:hypothetical protein